MGATGSGRVVRGLLVVKEHGLENRAHVPFHVIGEQAQDRAGARAAGVAVVDGAHFEIDGFEAAERVFHEAQALVAPGDGGGFQPLFPAAGAHDTDAVEDKGPLVEVAGGESFSMRFWRGSNQSMAEVISFLRFLQKPPDRIRSYFQAPTTCYAS
ncbi:MAG: hypothetical protein M0Q93_11370 [Terrimicrobiaceae bacterium]|nr:hypothetical protein [Terrimicrobiaceae bacterium]